jgi:hypothetical protein
MSAFLHHPSQGFQATSSAGEDIQVVLMWELTQSMAMTAQASSMPYNLQTLDLPVHLLASTMHVLASWSSKRG